jgi:hypothetical protein
MYTSLLDPDSLADGAMEESFVRCSVGTVPGHILDHLVPHRRRDETRRPLKPDHLWAEIRGERAQNAGAAHAALGRSTVQRQGAWHINPGWLIIVPAEGLTPKHLGCEIPTVRVVPVSP